MQISAIDMVYALSSILESPKNLSKKDYGTFSGSTEEQKRNSDSTLNTMSNRATSVAVNPITKEADKEYNLEAA